MICLTAVSHSVSLSHTLTRTEDDGFRHSAACSHDSKDEFLVRKEDCSFSFFSFFKFFVIFIVLYFDLVSL